MLRLLRAFLNWCAEHLTYGAIAKTDALQREHLPAWFAGVLADTNPHARAYLVGLLRLWHDKIEAWMLEQAGVKFDRKSEPGRLALMG